MLLSKNEIYQWDKGVYITFSEDEQINQVHFSHIKFKNSTDVDVIDGSCEIPETLLRISGTLYAWGVVKGDDSLLTEFVEEINIIQRARPSDYVYTPEEIKQWSDLKEQIGDLELLDTEKKENLVSAINEVLKTGGADETPRIETSESIITLEPNKYYVFPEMATLDITLSGELDSSIVQEFSFRFTSAATATTLVLPETIKGNLTIEANKIYEVSIIDNLLAFQSWEVKQ